jgi:hypothetical protein
VHGVRFPLAAFLAALTQIPTEIATAPYLGMKGSDSPVFERRHPHIALAQRKLDNGRLFQLSYNVMQKPNSADGNGEVKILSHVPENGMKVTRPIATARDG